MKSTVVLLPLFLFALLAQGQFHSAVSQLQFSDENGGVAEISLLFNERHKERNFQALESRLVMIAASIHGTEFKWEHNRFITRMGEAFEWQGKTFITVNMYYDNETNIPHDDELVTSVHFEVPKELLTYELTYYDGQVLTQLAFFDAPAGKTTFEEEYLERVKY